VPTGVYDVENVFDLLNSHDRELSLIILMKFRIKVPLKRIRNLNLNPSLEILP
jgi:hypothetical protein